ncbi:ETX/MTX2 family pore-forming toxin [Streptomyces griseus]|uniref:ETX/MTX2 family pore-forming toxin n=1 Tax=Streptomyces griseus TaxID=1911 RepID=UPI0033D192B5
MTNYLERIFFDFWTAHPNPFVTTENLTAGSLELTRAEVLGDATLGVPVIKPSTDTERLYSQEYTNDTSVEQTQTLKAVRTVTRTVTASKTKTFEANQEISMQVKLEGFGSMGGKISFKEGQSETSSESSRVTETWEVDNPIVVPPHKTVEAVLWVDEGELSVDYEGRAHLYLEGDDNKTLEIGFVVNGLDLSTDEKKAYYGFDLGTASAPDSPRYRVDGGQLIGHATGTLSAKAGVRTRTVATEKGGTQELQTLTNLPGDAQRALLLAVLTAKA